jgi:hypothetical protein
LSHLPLLSFILPNWLTWGSVLSGHPRTHPRQSYDRHSSVRQLNNSGKRCCQSVGIENKNILFFMYKYTPKSTTHPRDSKFKFRHLHFATLDESTLSQGCRRPLFRSSDSTSLNHDGVFCETHLSLKGLEENKTAYIPELSNFKPLCTQVR